MIKVLVDKFITYYKIIKNNVFSKKWKCLSL